MNRNVFIPKPVSEYDLRLLRIFKVVVECGGLSNAEPVLNITRSTISVHLSNLEGRMKFRLAKRGRGGFALTEQGKAVYEASLGLFRSLDDFSAFVSSLDEDVSGELVILCSDNVASLPELGLPKVIRALNSKAPQLQLAINNETTPNIEKALLDGSAHIGIMPEFRRIDGLEYRSGFVEQNFLFCGKEHEFFHLDDDQIDQERLNQTMTVHPGVEITSAGIEQLRNLNLTARAYQYDTRVPLVLSGNYLGFFPFSYAQPWIDRGELRPLLMDSCHYSAEIVVALKHQQVQDSKLNLFIEILQDMDVLC